MRSGSIRLSSEQVRGDLDTIHRNACHISNLIDDVLDLSQVDAHRLALQKRQVTLAQIVEDARATLATLFDEAGLGLRIDLPNDLPVLFADPLRIRQALINLLSNAVRHTDEGEVGITARLDGQQVVVSVSDTGEGIAPEDLPGVFDAFRQAGEVSRRRGGSGLGLAVTKQFIEMHGGNIWAESDPESGSVFHFSLPLQGQVVADPPAPNLGRLIGPPPADGATRTLLFVDSDQEPSRLLGRYLDGCKIIGVKSPAELDRLPDRDAVQALVITDPAYGDEWRAPINGEAEAARLPVLSCSLRTQRQIGRELGASAYLAKPVSREALVAALGEVATRVDNVLIVDDDDELADLLGRMVGSAFARCRIARAGDGVGALAAMRATRPDVVLLDLLMPRLDGYGVLSEMRSDETLRDVPVVVVTARGVHDESITASSLSISRVGGLTIGELVACMQACLDALLSAPPDPAGDQSRSGRDADRLPV
jgi:CheY-like chemotaxis protein